jgi:capsular polysaccharide transport system permease protein
MAATKTAQKDKSGTFQVDAEALDGRSLRTGDGTMPSTTSGTAVGVKEIDAETTTAAPQTASGGGFWRLSTISLLVCVALPFILACFYYFALATDQYVAETRFAVRSLASGSSSDASGQLLTTSPLAQDGYVVTSFIHSTEILRRIEERVDLRSYFQRDEIDYFSRLADDATREDLLDYWSNQVTTYIDGPSGIITLRVRAHSPEDARELAQIIIEESEILVNQLSERARADYIRRAEQEVASTAGRYEQALAQLNEFQNDRSILSVEAQATETGQLLTGLLQEKLTVDSRLFVLAQNSISDAPQVRQLQRTQEALDTQIAELRGQLASGDTADGNLSRYLREFAEYETERLLASGLYEAARRNLAQAELEADRQAVYVTVFVEPSVPEDARYPQRFIMPLLILLGCAIAWGIVALIIASVEDHRT